MGVLVWSPLASGWLSGAIREGREITTSRAVMMPQRFDLSVPANRARLDAVERLVKVADAAGLTLIQLALGFMTAHPPSPARSSARARSSTCTRSWPQPTLCWTTVCSTPSTRSSRQGWTSHRKKRSTRRAVRAAAMSGTPITNRDRPRLVKTHVRRTRAAAGRSFRAVRLAPTNGS
jgi:hypothetical protein